MPTNTTHFFCTMKANGCTHWHQWRTSKKTLEPLSLYSTSCIWDGPFHLLSSLSCSTHSCCLSFLYSAHLYPSRFNRSSPLFFPSSFIFFSPLPPLLSHLWPFLPWPLPSVPAGYSPDLDFHFPPLPCLLSPSSLLKPPAPGLLFAPQLSSLHSFSFRGSLHIAFSQRVTLGISRRLKENLAARECLCVRVCVLRVILCLNTPEMDTGKKSQLLLNYQQLNG